MAATREIKEETGIIGSIVYPLKKIQYSFLANSFQKVHKTVHHFLFKFISGNLTIKNDPDKEAVKAKWLEINEARKKLSFSNERKVIDLAKKIINKL